MKSFLKGLVVSVITYEAKLILKRTKPTIAAITGSVGKTTTKDAIYQAISKKIHARKSEKSYNTELGVPLTVLGLSNAGQSFFHWLKNILDGFFLVLFPGDYPKVLVLEMGVDHPGDMKRLTSWIKPDMVVLTRLPDVPVHVEFFSSPQEVIEEKLELVRALKPDGVLIYNQDDEKVRDAAELVRQQSIGYSRYSQSQFTVSGDEIVYEGDQPVGMTFKISHIHDRVEFSVNGVIGVQHCYNFGAATAVAAQFDIGLEEAANALKDFRPTPGRMRIIKGLKDTIILDDTYNSSPTAAERALSNLFEVKASGRKIAVLGDMLELGGYSAREHEKVGEQAADGVDLLITVGVRARGIAEGALEHGLAEEKIIQYDEAIRAGRELQYLIEPGDVILIKGSQGMRMEKIVLDIMAEPRKAEKLLVRQSIEWQAPAKIS